MKQKEIKDHMNVDGLYHFLPKCQEEARSVETNCEDSRSSLFFYEE